MVIVMQSHRRAAASCSMQFGAFFSKNKSDAENMRASDYLTVWIGTKSKAFGSGFNPHYHGRMLERVRAQNGTAVYYAYVIAMLARHSKGIVDCDVGSPSLCVHGADFVRAFEPLILRTYESYANKTAVILGRQAAVVWLMEPDWHQYSESTQRGGGLAQSEMVRLFVAMVERIKRHLPSSLISFDVSPWVVDVGEWLQPFLQHAPIDYVHTSGGRTTAASLRIRAQEEANLLTWHGLHKLAGGRGIIADTGYGVGGRLTRESALDHAWREEAHLRARLSDGVVAVTYAASPAGWATALGKLRTALPPLPLSRRCFGAAGTSSSSSRAGGSASIMRAGTRGAAHHHSQMSTRARAAHLAINSTSRSFTTREAKKTGGAAAVAKARAAASSSQHARIGRSRGGGAARIPAAGGRGRVAGSSGAVRPPRSTLSHRSPPTRSGAAAYP